MFELDNPFYLWFLLVVPVVGAGYLLLKNWQSKKRNEVLDSRLHQYMIKDLSIPKKNLSILLKVATISAFCIALVNPKVGERLESIKRKGVDIVFLIDVSKSMLAEDIKPNRMEKAKQIIRSIIEELAGDRIGIIAYAGKPYPLLPITTDYGAAQLFIDDINTDIVPSFGTSIGEAVDMTSQYFNDKSNKKRVAIIISDGEDHEGNVEQSIEQATENDVTFFTIGVGLSKGGPIPIKRNGATIGFKKDNEDVVVITKLNEGVLQDIARTGKGGYVDGTNTTTVKDFITENLLKMQKTEFESKMYSDYAHQFQWFIGLGLFFLCFDLLIFERKTQWLTRLNLFNENKTTDV